LRVAVVARRPERAHGGGDRRIVVSPPHELAQVEPLAREEAGEQAPLGRQPGAGAGAAEGLRHRSDDADLPRASAVAPAFGDFTAIVRLHRLEREDRVDAAHDVARALYLLGAPAI